MNNNLKILIIEDEPSISDNIEYALKTEGFAPVCADTGAVGLKKLSAGDFALIILDIGLPDANGFDLCREIRKLSDIPIIFLTARDSEIDRVIGLEIGGDDYLTKPFSPRELTARIRAVLRRTGTRHTSPKPNETNDSILKVNSDKKEISYHGEVLNLSHYEYEILALMAANPGKSFSRADLMNMIWESPEMSMERTVDTHIKTIRSKLNAIRPGESPIVTNRGFGYYLDIEIMEC